MLLTLRERIDRFLFGPDVFISYARKGGLKYAVALAEALSDRGLACSIDQLEAWPGAFGKRGETLTLESPPPPHLLRQLRRTSMLVVVGTRGAAASIPVGVEIKAFRSTHEVSPEGHGISVIDLDGILAVPVEPVVPDDPVEPKVPPPPPPIWEAQVEGIRPMTEGADWRVSGPSQATVQALDGLALFDRRSRRQQRATRGVAALLLFVMLVTGGLSYLAYDAGERAIAADEGLREAVARESKARDETRRAETSANEAAQQTLASKAVAAAARQGAQAAQAAEAEARRRQGEAEQQAATAREQARIAKQARERAEADTRSVNLAADSRRVFGDDPALALQMDIAAIGAAATADAVQALRDHLDATTPRRSFEDAVGAQRGACITRDFRQVVTIDDLRAVNLWDPIAGTRLRRFENADYYHLACGNRSSAVVTHYRRGGALWTSDQPTALVPLRPGPPVPRGIAFAPDDQHLIIWDQTELAYYDRTGQRRSLYRMPRERRLDAAQLVAGPDRAVIETVGDTATLTSAQVELIDLSAPVGKQLQPVALGRGRLERSADGRALKSHDTLWGLDPLRRWSSLAEPNAFAPDGPLLILSRHDQTTVSFEAFRIEGSGELARDAFIPYAPKSTLGDIRRIQLFPARARDQAVGLWEREGLMIRDPATGMPLADLHEKDDLYETSGAFVASGDGRHLFYHGEVWDLSGKNLFPSRRLAPERQLFDAAAFTADGKGVVTARSQWADNDPVLHTLDLWRWEKERPQPVNLALSNGSQAIVAAPCEKGDCLVLVDADDNIRLVHSDGRVEPRTPAVAPSSHPYWWAVAASSNARVVAACAGPSNVVVWIEGRSPRQLTAPMSSPSVGFCSALALTPDGDTLAVSTPSETVLIDVADSRALTPGLPVTQGAFDPSGRRFLGVGEVTGELMLWERGDEGWTPQPTRRFVGSSGKAAQVGWSADGRFALTLDKGARVLIVWDTTLGNVAWRRTAPSSVSIQAVRWLDGQRIVSFWSSGAVRVDRCEVCVGAADLVALAASRARRREEIPASLPGPRR